jgi:cytochrome P450
MEAALILATIAQKFQLRLVPGQTVAPLASITLRPRHGIRVTLEARKPAEAHSSFFKAQTAIAD